MMGGARWRGILPVVAATASLATALVGSGVTQAIVRQDGGGSAFLVAFGSSGLGAEVAAYDVHVAVRGGVSIRFHGDRHAGCQRYGLCGYRGQLALRPDGAGEILLVKYRHHHRITYEVTLFTGLAAPAGFDAHVVRWSSGHRVGLCADESLNGAFPSGTARAGHAITLRLVQAGDGQLAGRCAGPMAADVTPVSPQVTFPVRRLMNPGSAIRLVGTHRFLAHGFVGTITSTIVLRVGKRHREPTGSGHPSGRTERIRIVTERLNLVRTTGGFRAEFHGVRAPGICRLVDSCGLRGTLRWSPVPNHVTAVLMASGLASRPMRDFRAALGLGRGHIRGIALSASVDWDNGGWLSEKVARRTRCTDAVGLGPGAISAAPARSRAIVFYDLTSPLRTRCPGPLPLWSGNSAIDGEIPVERLRRASFVLDVRPTPAVNDDGYAGRLTGHLLLVLRRTRRTRSDVITVPAFAVGLYDAPRAAAG